MITLGHAGTAETAVFGSCWLNNVASRTVVVRSEQSVVIWIVEHAGVEICFADVVSSAGDREVCEDVWHANQDWDR